MGWDYSHATHYKNGKVDRKAECDELYTWSNETKTVRVLKSSMKGTIYYAAVEITTSESKEVIGVVAATAGADKNDPYFNFGVKTMDETMQPFYYDCPKGILDLLTPTDNECANEWRRLCREKTEKKVDSWLKALPYGSQVKWIDCNGKEQMLIKHEPAYQFKTWFWYNASSGGYVPKKYVTERNTVRL